MAPKTETNNSSVSKKSTSKKEEKPTKEVKATKQSTSKKEEKAPKTPRAKSASKKEEKPKEPKAPKEPKQPKAPKQTTEDGEQKEQVKKERRIVSKESLNTDFEALVTLVNEEIGRLRESKPKAKGIKFLKTLNKVVKQLHNDANRVTKFKKQTVRKTNTSSGFLKPVNISPELAKFTGWDVNQTYSRTQVTKFICEYVKKNKLFNEEGDKRNILVDEKLKALLKYDPKNAPKDPETGQQIPLTYFRLQQYLKYHFIKPTADSTEEELDE